MLSSRQRQQIVHAHPGAVFAAPPASPAPPAAEGRGERAAFPASCPACGCGTTPPRAGAPEAAGLLQPVRVPIPPPSLMPSGLKHDAPAARNNAFPPPSPGVPYGVWPTGGDATPLPVMPLPPAGVPYDVSPFADEVPLPGVPYGVHPGVHSEPDSSDACAAAPLPLPLPPGAAKGALVAVAVGPAPGGPDIVLPPMMTLGVAPAPVTPDIVPPPDVATGVAPAPGASGVVSPPPAPPPPGVPGPSNTNAGLKLTLTPSSPLMWKEWRAAAAATRSGGRLGNCGRPCAG